MKLSSQHPLLFWEVNLK
jgi:hypothetical protein